MKYYNMLAKKRFGKEKTEFFLLVITTAVTTAALLLTLTLSTNYLTFLVNSSQEVIGISFSLLLKNNISNLSEIGEYTGDFLWYLKYGLTDEEIEELEEKQKQLKESSSSSHIEGYLNEVKAENMMLLPQAENADSVFSPMASVENLPSTIILLSLVVLFMVNSTLSIVFRLCKKSRRSFLITMLGAGDTMRGIKKYVRVETKYILSYGVPIGLLCATVCIYAVRLIAKIFFEKRNFSPFPVNINISVSALFVSVLIISLLVFRFSAKAYSGISVSQVASALKTKLATDNGIRTMTASPKKYKRKGMEHFVSIGNFSSNIMNYISMIVTTSITLLIFVIIVMMFDIIRNYSGQGFASCSSKLFEFSFASEFYFFVVAVPLVVISVLSVFACVFANITSNTGIYALMRSAGSDIGAVLKAVRKEGNFIAVTNCVVAVFTTLTLTTITFAIYDSDSRVTTGGIWKIWMVVALAVLLLFISIFLTTYFMKKKMKKLDMIGTLKNLYY